MYVPLFACLPSLPFTFVSVRLSFLPTSSSPRRPRPFVPSAPDPSSVCQVANYLRVSFSHAFFCLTAYYRTQPSPYSIR